jgi:hypothetical protein
MKKLLLALVTLFVLTACVDEGKATEILSSHGYTEIQITGYNMFSCSEDDTFKTGFTAKTITGQITSGTVCCGLFMKGCTVRLD